MELTSSNKYVTAKVNHFQNGTVVESSTSEWAIKQHLFKGNDTSAYINLAKVGKFIGAVERFNKTY